MAKHHLTTGEVASLCSVTRDAVLKWIKSGKISAIQTPGGHYRIHRQDIPSDLVKKHPSSTSEKADRPYQYCWEFYGNNGTPLEMCRHCIIYRAKVKRCYEMSQIPVEVGHVRQFCATTCDECDYYQEVLGQRYKVLIVTNRSEVQTTLESEAAKVNINMAFCSSEYKCAVLVQNFFPDFILIDSAIGREQSRNLVQHLCEDTRLPIVRILMAGDEFDVPEQCRQELFARINSDFSAFKLEELIERLSG